MKLHIVTQRQRAVKVHEPVKLLLINSERVQAFFLRIFLINSPDVLHDKWTIMHELSSNILFQAFFKCLHCLRQ